MNDTQWWKRERGEQPIEFVPVHLSLAMPSAEPATPRAMNQETKLFQRFAVTRDSKVRIVSSNLPAQSGMLVDNPT